MARTPKQPVTIQFERFERGGRLVVQERTFPSQAALDRWAQSHEDTGTYLKILRYERTGDAS